MHIRLAGYASFEPKPFHPCHKCFRGTNLLTTPTLIGDIADLCQRDRGLTVITTFLCIYLAELCKILSPSEFSCHPHTPQGSRMSRRDRAVVVTFAIGAKLQMGVTVLTQTPRHDGRRQAEH